VGSYEFFVCLGARTPGLFLGCWFLICGVLLIEREQAFENLFVGKIDRKTVGLSDGGIAFCSAISFSNRTGQRKILVIITYLPKDPLQLGERPELNV
jgi:hypothetical protein